MLNHFNSFRFSFSALLLILAMSSQLSASEREKLILYQNARFELIQIGFEEQLSLDSLQDALIKANSALGKPRCSIAGALQRDTLFDRYAAWIANNLRPGVDKKDLTARHPHVKERLKKMRDHYLLILVKTTDHLWLLLFHNGDAEPFLLKQYPKERSPLAIIPPLFKGRAIPIPTEKERKVAEKEPDQFFRDQLPLDQILTVGGGAMRGFWGHPSAQIEEYTNNRDSTSAWDWIKQKSPLLFLEYGVSYARFAAIAGYLQWSQHGVKFNPQTNPAIDEWSLLRWEFGLRTRLGYTFFTSTRTELYPYLALAFHFTIYQEFIEWNEGIERPDERFHLVALTGASVGSGIQFLYDARWGLRCEGGVARRARRARDVEPGGSRPPDRPGEESYELYWSLGVVKSFRKFL